MGKLVQPKVYFVGFQQINYEELERYLHDSGNQDYLATLDQAKQEGLSGAEILCSTFAKLCYKSLSLGQNANITRVRDIESNLKACFNAGHGCYDEETQVLTSLGWKLWKDVNYEDLLATRTAEGLLEYHKPLRLVSYLHKGSMYKVENSAVDLLVTPDHKMLACKMTTKEGRKKKNFRLYTAESLKGVSHCYTKVAELQQPVTLNIKNEQLALLGFIIGDMGYEGGNMVRSSLRKPREINFLKKNAEILGWSVEESTPGRWFLRWPKEEIYFTDLVSRTYKNKARVIPEEILTNGNITQLKYLFSGLMNSDGNFCIKGESSDTYLTTDRELADQVQQLLLHIGSAGHISVENERQNSYGDKPLYTVTILTKNLKPQINQSSGDQYAKLEEVKDWEGTVYCAEVPNNTLFVRRNGIPVWSGNSIFEHVNFNFVAADVSRVFTHELVRHRVGTAFSQNSGRYIRLDNIDIVFDPILDPIRELCQEKQAYDEAWYARAVKESGLEEMKDFSSKKKMTSALRRFAPNGQSNEIAFSMNLRTIRHTIMVRTNRHAEWEIRVVFAEIYKLMKEKYPLMFYDASETLVEGIIEVSGMKTQPYEMGEAEVINNASTETLKAELKRRGVEV
jgi:flavin-dependent thymidylate synthase